MSENNAGYWRVSATAVAVGSLMVTLASLATLVTVVSVKDIDTLSTVALVLAVLAFVVQLIVFVVQSAAADAQHRNAQELHAAMMATLSRIQERTQGTQASVERMNTRLLDAAIGKASSEGFELGTPAYAAEVARSLSTTGAGRGNINPSSGRVVDDLTSESLLSNYPAPMAKDTAKQIHEEMTTWPSSDEMPAVLEDINSLSLEAQFVLNQMAMDVARFSEPASPIGPGMSRRSPELEEKGLIRKIPGWKLYTLTDEGRRIGRVFSAKGLAPVNAAELIDLREELRNMAEERRQRSLSNRDEE